MPRRALLAFAAALAVGLAVVAWRAGGSGVTQAFQVGPGPTPQALALFPRAEVCQTPIEVLADTDAVRLWARALTPGTPIEVTVRDLGGRPLRRDRVTVPRGAPASVTARFAPLREGTSIALCIRNAGSALVIPSGGEQAPDTGTVIGGRQSGVDVTVVFLRERPRSALGLVPTMFRRAALFRFGWVGAWTFWALAALVLVVAPALCALAVARAARE